MMETRVNILIVGGGTTGCGSAWRLNELVERKLLPQEIKWLLIDRIMLVGRPRPRLMSMDLRGMVVTM